MAAHIIPDKDSNGVPVLGSSPFPAKKLNGKSFFARNHGITHACSIGENTITFNAPYAWAKVMGVEVVNCEALDKADFKVYTSNDVLLNQFAFSINLPKDFYRREARFDADFIAGLKIVIVYNSISAKTVGLNFIMDEVV